MKEKMKVLLVGRHSGEIPGVEVVEQVSPTYPADLLGTAAVLKSLLEKADGLGTDVKLLFQNVPGQLAVALANTNLYPMSTDRVGVIVSTPGKREAGVRLQFPGMGNAERAVKFANPNAKTEIMDGDLIVTVDPPMKFNLNRIIWLDGMTTVLANMEGEG